MLWSENKGQRCISTALSVLALPTSSDIIRANPNIRISIGFPARVMGSLHTPIKPQTTKELNSNLYSERLFVAADYI